MIPQRDLSWQHQSWQEQLTNSITSSSALLQILNVSEQDFLLSNMAQTSFPVLAPQAFVSRMRIGDKDDPLLRQVINHRAEDLVVDGYQSDPLNESEFNPVKGLIRKYKNRALLVTTGKCAINCRYCFRREFPYSENNPSRLDWQNAFSYIAENPEIDEVILSGGDPLIAGDKHLNWMIDAISKLPNVRHLRIHTRLPVVIPDRVTASLTRMLQQTPMITSVVLHINHASEIDDSVRRAARDLKASVDFLLNQSVLLKGVNNALSTQVALQRACVESGIMPYYLHFLDTVTGTSHFKVQKEDALALYADMQRELSGYMLPKLVVETPRALSKQFLR